MSRRIPLPKDILSTLLAGHPTSWEDPDTGNTGQIVLNTPEQRRLLRFLLGTTVRTAKGLSPAFLDGIKAAFLGDTDPATEVSAISDLPSAPATWLLRRIEVTGVGGVNRCDGEPFVHDLDGASLCLEGANGSGKSSLIGAIQWAMTGERTRDHLAQSGVATEPREAVEASGRALPAWPPLAAYPPDSDRLKQPPRVRVALTFVEARTQQLAMIERTLNGASVEVRMDPSLAAASALIEIGCVMPSRVSQLRFGDKGGRLGDAVQSLTGLDSVAVIGDFVADLSHAGREFLAWAKRQHTDEFEATFVKSLLMAAQYLPLPAQTAVRDLRQLQDEHIVDKIKQVVENLVATAGEQLGFIKGDIATTIDLADLDQQNQVRVAVQRASDQVANAIKIIPTLFLLNEISRQQIQLSQLVETLAEIDRRLDDALAWHRRQKEDSKLRLKAMAAKWHRDHHLQAPEIKECPLCEQLLTKEPQQRLAQELRELHDRAQHAVRAIEDSARELDAQLVDSVPESLRSLLPKIAALMPRSGVLSEIDKHIARNPQFTPLLPGLTRLVTAKLAALGNTLPEFLEDPVSPPMPELPVLDRLRLHLLQCRRLVLLGKWWAEHVPAYRNLWKQVIGLNDAEKSPEDSLKVYLARLTQAVASAEPYRLAVEQLQSALLAGQEWQRINHEHQLRQRIVAALAPLKQLRILVDSEAKATIRSLSGKIKDILRQIYLTDQLRFEEAFRAKQMVGIRGSFTDAFWIDATLVANTSWLRAILWAFIFSLREQIIEGRGHNPLPLLLLDDSQSTFDLQHRKRWAEYLANLSNVGDTESIKAQVVLVSYDRAFLDELRDYAKVKARFGALANPGSTTGALVIVEGSWIEREWSKLQQDRTASLAREFIRKLRIHIESMLKLMLRGHLSIGPGSNLDSIRREIEKLHGKSAAPFQNLCFDRLIRALDAGNSAVKLLNDPAHMDDDSIGYPEAETVQKYWQATLQSPLQSAFDLFRQFTAYHGDPRIYASGTASIQLPLGRRDTVKALRLVLQGEAAAMTDGRTADGRLLVEEWDEERRIKHSLVNHGVYRLTAPTMEPVASPGDLLIVSNYAKVNAKNLVVAAVGDQLVARRYEASTHRQMVVLTAHALCPYDIREPIVVDAKTIEPKKVVGVLFDARPPVHRVGDGEVMELGSDGELTSLIDGDVDLFRIRGRSAEPYALEGQYLIVRSAVTDGRKLLDLNGRPVLAEDDQGQRYFKRLRTVHSDFLVLESLDLSGREGVVLLSTGEDGRHPRVARMMPVAGVLFELST